MAAEGKRGYRDSLTMIDISKAFKEERGKDNEFPFEFADEDILEREASEIYSLYEIAEFGIGQAAFEEMLREDFEVDKWMECSMDTRKQFVISFLDVLETHAAPDTTERTLRALQYVSQGVVAECANGVGDVRMARLNNGLLKQCCCFPTLVQGLCRASKRAAIQHVTTKKGNIKPDTIVSLYLNILYNMLLFNQNDPAFASEIETTRFEGSPFVVILFDLITEFNEQPDSPLPAKKLLMVLWKAIATTLGSMSALKKQKMDLLHKMGVPTASGPSSTKSRLEDFETLKRDAERHQHNVVFTRVFEIPDAKYLTVKRTHKPDKPMTGVMESPPNSPRLARLSIESLRAPAPDHHTTPKTTSLTWDTKPSKPLPQTLRLPPALGEAFRIMEKNLYIPPATLQHPEFQHSLDALRANPKNPAPPPPHATLPRILLHPDSQSGFERLYRQILPNLANHLVFILKIMLAAAPTVKNYAGTINLNLEGPVQETTRHREIVLKACTALLLLLLKHARYNNLLQFAHIRSIMIDAKAVLLMLKLVNHDLNTHISSPTDPPEMCLFPPPPEPEIFTQTYLAGSYRNFFSMTAVLRILQKLSKKNGVALRILHQYKAPAILKKTLDTHHHSVRLYTLKIFKSLVPYLPRKWRAMNMKIISEIYCYVRLDTRDDWLSGDPDLGAKDVMETAQIDEFLRTQYIEWWHYIKEGTKDRLVYNLDEPLGMDPVQALLARVELDEDWKANWESWVAWEEREGNSARDYLYLPPNKHHT
eukprot:Phypoly_transcript_03690.p1 GENE.Phypoly_transcript_03690~~Phypoly_transcript_03690.p1  ORF type:complete len:763 (+),score=148.68 Phypoly_transcript_03690:95-2383(+)